MRLPRSKLALVMIAANEIRGSIMTAPLWAVLIHHWFHH